MKYLEIPDLSVPDYERLIDTWVYGDRDKEIMKLKLIRILTYEQVAEMVGMSDSQIKRIVKKWRKELSKHL